MEMKRAQISVVEGILMILLFVFFFSSLTLYSQTTYTGSSVNLDSLLDSIYYSENYRDIIMNEDLSSEELSQDWSEIESVLNNSVGSYELILLNKTTNKKITECQASYGKNFEERIFGSSQDEYEFRKLRIGVCY